MTSGNGCHCAGIAVPVVLRTAGGEQLRTRDMGRNIPERVGVVLRPEAASGVVRRVGPEAVLAETAVEEGADIRKRPAVLRSDIDAELMREKIPHLVDARARPHERMAGIVEDGANRHRAALIADGTAPISGRVRTA